MISHTTEDFTKKDHLEKPACNHCGESCEAELIERDGLSFCCQGCSLVHQMLNEHQLGDYYRLEKNPGISLRGRSLESRYAYLDDESIRQRLIDFSDGGGSRLRFYLPQIHCTSCLWLLERLPWIHAGISQAQVNYLRKEVSIAFHEESLSLRQLAELLASLGYAPHISLEDGEQSKKTDRSFYYQLGVTGFCAGNIMLMSFPEYLGIGDTDAAYSEIFGYLNLLLSIPVFFYGGRSYILSAYQAIKHRGINIDVPITLGMFALWLQSSYEVISGSGAGYFDSLAALVFLLLLGKWFQQRSFDHISFDRDYKSYFPIAVSKKVGEAEETVPLEKLAKGDRVLLRNGELIPADAILVKGRGRIDYSFITGEADPVSREEGELLYAGGRQQGGMIELELVKEVSQSYLTQLWNSDAFQKEGKKLQTITDRLGARFTYAVLLIATLTAIYWWPISPATAVSTFAAVLIIACPCALALNVPFALGNVLRILAKKGFYAKDTATIERLARIGHWVFDKTGTIAVAGEVAYVGEPLSEEMQVLAKTLANHSTHPLSQQVARSLQPKIALCPEVEGFEEKPGEGIRGIVGGRELLMGKASFVGVDLGKKSAFQTQVHLAADGEYLGCFELRQQLRPGIKGLLSRLGTAAKLALISGDHEGERERLSEVFGADAVLKFRQSPSDKMEHIKSLQRRGESVGMIGDGLNDAAALKQSDVGIAVSEEVQQFSPACDIIVQADHLQQLDRLQWLAKRAVWVVYAGFGLSLAYNVVGLSYAVQGLLEPVIAAILMPLSSITVVGFGMAMTSWLGKRF